MKPTEGAGPLMDIDKPSTSKVRRSVGEIEARQLSPRTKKTEQPQEEKPKQKLTGGTKPVFSQKTTAEVKSGPQKSKPSATDMEKSPSPRTPTDKYKSRTAEAKACLLKVKLQIDRSRNLKAEIKAEVIDAVERLYVLVKEAERAKPQNAVTHPDPEPNPPSDHSILAKIEQHSKHLKENTRMIEELKDSIERQKDQEERRTYANVLANSHRQPPLTNRETLHSVVIASTDDSETGEDVLDRVRKAADAKEGWIAVQRVRKAKDRKVIMGFKTKEDQTRMKERLGKEGNRLVVEEVKNKDPLLVLKDVLLINSDEDVLKALKNQNRNIFHGLDEGEDRAEIKYRRKARNPLTGHIIIGVSPRVWRRALEAGTLHIDLQQVKVADQSPLVQCTRCLAYGHGRRLCKEAVDACSHCGGPHLRVECAEWLVNTAPTCKNCCKAKIGNVGHNAFSGECPIRKRWDDLARQTIAYC